MSLSMDTLPSTSSLYEVIHVPKDCQDRAVLYNQCIQVRIEVFVHEQGFALGGEVDEVDPIATHFLLRLISSKLAPIGTLRIHQPNPNATEYYKLGRLVVLKEHRKYGLGAALMRAAHQYIRDSCKSSNTSGEIVLHSQIPVQGFYAKLGYVSEGDEFEEDGAPHRRMRVQLDN